MMCVQLEGAPMEEGGERGAPATSHHLPLLDKLASAYAAARSAAAEAAATATGAPHRSNQAVRRRALHRQGGSLTRCHVGNSGGRRAAAAHPPAPHVFCSWLASRCGLATALLLGT